MIKVSALLITACLAVCFAFSSRAQEAPGYLGKLNTLEYNYGAFLGYNFNVDALRFSDNHSFQYNHVLDRRTSVGISYTHYGIDIDANDVFYSVYTSELRQLYKSSTKVYGKYRISGNDLGLHIRFYQNNWIAPLGVYHQVGVKAIMLNPTNNEAYYYMDSKKTTLEPSKPFFTSLGITYTFGKTKVFFDRLLLNYGVQLNWMASTVYPFYEEYKTQLVDDYFRKTMNKNVYFDQMVKVKLGIGLLH